MRARAWGMRAGRHVRSLIALLLLGSVLWSPLAFTQGDRLQSVILQGAEAARSRDRGAAERAAESALALATSQPTRAVVLSHIAAWRADLGDYARADAALAEALAALDKEPGLQRERGELAARRGAYAFSAGDLPRAISLYEEALAISADITEQRLAIAAATARVMSIAGRAGDAVDLLRRELQRAARLPSEAKAKAEIDLASALVGVGALSEAEASAKSALENLKAPQDKAAAQLVLGRALTSRGALSAAERALQAALPQAAGDGILAAQVEEARGHLAVLRGDGIAARDSYQAAAVGLVGTLGPDHGRLAAPLTGLAIAHQLLREEQEAQRAYARAYAASVKGYGPTHPRTLAVRIEMARLAIVQRRFEDALSDAESALEVLDPQNADTRFLFGLAHAARAFSLSALGENAEATKSFETALAAIEAARGPHSPDLVAGLLELSTLKLSAGGPTQAERHAARAIAILQRGQLTGPAYAEALGLRAEALLALGRKAEALRLTQDAANLMTERRALATSATTPEAAQLEQRAQRRVYERALDLAFAGLGASGMTSAQAFENAQALHLGAASTSVAQLSARHASGDARLAQALRKREDTRLALSALEQQIGDLVSAESPRPMSTVLERRKALRTELAAADEALRRDNPRFSDLLQPSVVSVAEVQRSLGKGEALLVHASTQQGTHLFLVRYDSPRLIYAHRPVSAQVLEDLAWRVRVSVTPTASGRLRAFDREAARGLYDALLAPFTEQLGDIDTLVAALDASMTTVPLAILAPAGQQGGAGAQDFVLDQRATAWTPSAGAFVALRRLKGSGDTRLPFFGVGDPLLNGGGTQEQRGLAQLAARFRSGVDPEALRSLSRLENTRQELRALADAFGATSSDLLLGAEATEAKVRARPLERYRVLAFATHGLLAGDFGGVSEPGLVMTPPAKASALEDGLLSASEVSTLRLNADWVILSACDTAGGGKGAFASEGLAGLARAFFYAGARSLLVSGWPAETDAAEFLTTNAVRMQRDTPTLNRAEALRLSALKLKSQGGAQAHPALWGVFVIVGDPG